MRLRKRLQPSSHKPNLSIFDLDGTLITKNSSFTFGRWLFSKGKLPRSTVIANVTDYFLHRYFGLSIESIHRRAKERLLKSHSLEALTLFADSFVAETLPSLIDKKAKKRLEEARSQGHHLLLLSSSPSFIVKPIAEAFGITHWYASDWKEPVSILDGEVKLQIAKYVAAELKTPERQIFAYSDSHLDLPLLNSVANPISVNPDAILRKISLKNNWEIL